jgi:hypothetical protein
MQLSAKECGMKPMIQKGARVTTGMYLHGMVPGVVYTVTGHKVVNTQFGPRILNQLDGRLWVPDLPSCIKTITNNESSLML